jgi:hypothetical protein
LWSGRLRVYLQRFPWGVCEREKEREREREREREGERERERERDEVSRNSQRCL